jgi:hypothetical protein
MPGKHGTGEMEMFRKPRYCDKSQLRESDPARFGRASVVDERASASNSPLSALSAPTPASRHLRSIAPEFCLTSHLRFTFDQ